MKRPVANRSYPMLCNSPAPGGQLVLSYVAAHDADADDGERYLSEAALAAQWQGSVVLAQIGAEATRGQAYLDRMASNLTASVRTVLGQGKPGGALATLTQEHAITHVVVTSPGRTGLSRVIAGDAAAQLIDRLSLPIILVPRARCRGPAARAGCLRTANSSSGSGGRVAAMSDVFASPSSRRPFALEEFRPRASAAHPRAAGSE